MKEEGAECAAGVELKYMVACFDLVAYERLCRDVNFAPAFMKAFKRGWERGVFWKTYVTADQSYLVRVPQYVLWDPYSHHLFCFGGICCEVSGRRSAGEVLWVTPVGNPDTPRPDGFEAALFQALQAFYADSYKLTFDAMRPRIEWNRHGTLNGWRYAPPGQPQNAPPLPPPAPPRERPRRPEDSWLSRSTFLQLYLPVTLVLIMMFLTWLRTP